MSGGQTRKSFEKGLKWRPHISGGPRAYSLLKPSESGPFKPTFASEHDNRYIDM